MVRFGETFFVGAGFGVLEVGSVVGTLMPQGTPGAESSRGPEDANELAQDAVPSKPEDGTDAWGRGGGRSKVGEHVASDGVQGERGDAVLNITGLATLVVLTVVVETGEGLRHGTDVVRGATPVGRGGVRVGVKRGLERRESTSGLQRGRPRRVPPRTGPRGVTEEEMAPAAVVLPVPDIGVFAQRVPPLSAVPSCTPRRVSMESSLPSGVVAASVLRVIFVFFVLADVLGRDGRLLRLAVLVHAYVANAVLKAGREVRLPSGTLSRQVPRHSRTNTNINRTKGTP